MGFDRHQNTYQLLMVLMMACVSCNQNEFPNCEITRPVNGSTIVQNTTLSIQASVSDRDGTIIKVDLYVDGMLLDTKENSPYNFIWHATEITSTTNIRVVAVDNDGGISSDEIQISIIAGTNNSTDNVEPSDEVAYFALYTTRKPYCDGYIDDVDDPWLADRWAKLENKSSTYVDGNGIFTAQAQLMCDNRFLHLAVKVQDNTLFESELPENRDHIEIYISMDSIPNTDGVYGKDSWMISVQRQPDETLLCNYFSGYQGNMDGNLYYLINDQDFDFGIKDFGVEYIAELSLPIEILVNNGHFDGEYIRFDLAVTNNNGAVNTNKKYLFSNSGEQYRDTRKLSIVKLENGYLD